MRTRKRYQSRRSVRRARELRQKATGAERFLWQLVRRKNIGPKFRRQHPIGPFVVDYYCDALRLVIELDGRVHDSEVAALQDAARERWLRGRGLTIIRIRNEDLEANPKIVEGLIRSTVEDLLRHQRQG